MTLKGKLSLWFLKFESKYHKYILVLAAKPKQHFQNQKNKE